MTEETVVNGGSVPQSGQAEEETPPVEPINESSGGAPGQQDAPPSNPEE